MKWENLQTFDCPYCGEKLLDHGDDISCSVCVFHIEPSRYRKILEHRANPDKIIIKMRWQNLRDGKCPMDSSMLEQQANSSLLVCTTPGCTFKIREQRLSEILRDTEHPANRFYRPRPEEENLHDLNNL